MASRRRVHLSRRRPLWRLLPPSRGSGACIGDSFQAQAHCGSARLLWASSWLRGCYANGAGPREAAQTPLLRRRRRPALPTGGSQLRCGQTAKLTALVDYKKTEIRRSLWRQSEVLDGCGSDIHVVKSERLSPIEPIRRAVNAGRLDSFDDLTAKQEKLHE